MAQRGKAATRQEAIHKESTCGQQRHRGGHRRGGLQRDGGKAGRGMRSGGTAGHRLRAVMLLLLFLCVTEYFIIGGFFSRSPPRPPFLLATSPIPCTSLPHGPPRRKPDLLVSSSSQGDKSREWGPAMIRWRGAKRERERETREKSK